MSIKVTVKHRNGGTSVGEVWPSTEVAFEEEFGIAWTEAFSAQFVHQKYLYFAAYHALREAGQTSLPFPEWMKTVAEVLSEGDAEIPLDQEAPATTSQQ